MKSRRRDIDVFSMSFMDVVSCGFGAVILLLVLALALEPATVQKLTEDLRGSIVKRNEAREQHNADRRELLTELAALRRLVAEARGEEGGLESRLAAALRRAVTAEVEAARREDKTRDLETVRQRLTEEMKRLLSQADTPPPQNNLIGGIPIDSEYVIFIIDTSGSMRRLAWPLVVRKVREVLSVYPKVKGIQVLNDMGQYMFVTYRGRWIPDSPVRRDAIAERVKSWNSFSNSSPVEGIVAAIRGFYRNDRRISLYVFGDDFSGKNITKVVEEVARINRPDAKGRPRVRIHAFGFPVLFQAKQFGESRERFAHLMRVLAERNAGSFVGLNSLR